MVKGDILVALELYRDLGPGSLLFHTEYFTGHTFRRKSIEGAWINTAGIIGIYLNGEMMR